MQTLVVGSFMSQNLAPTYSQVAQVIGRALRRPAQLVTGTSLKQLRESEVDIAFLCGLPYVRVQAERPGTLTLLGAPVISEARCDGRPVYYSDVIVRDDSRFHDFADLRGARWSHTDPGSFSGCLLARYHLATLRETEAFFGAVTFAGSHQAAIGRVLASEVDAAAIDSHVLAVERRADPALSRLRVIATLGPSPVPPVVATRRLPGALVGQASEVLCGLAGDAGGRAILEPGMIRQFVSVTDSDYDDIRRKVAVAEASGAAV